MRHNEYVKSVYNTIDSDAFLQGPERMRVATGGHWGARPPCCGWSPQMKILQMGLHASDLAPLCSV